MSNRRKRVVVVSGGSSGIGLATASAFAEAGFIVYELSRRGKNAPGITHLSCDITHDEEVKEAVRSIIDEEGRIDIVVSNAGFGTAGPIETSKMDDIMRQFNVNYFGAVRLIQAVIPVMRAQNHGRILVISSVAAVVSIPFQIAYTCTKASLNQLVLGLNNELRPYNIELVSIMPGDIKTPFTEHREYAKDSECPIYGNRALTSIRKMERDEGAGSSCERLARHLVRLATKKRRPKPIQGYGLSYRAILVLERILPIRLTNYLLYQLYARKD